MPAKSEAQRRFMALVHAVQTGKAKTKSPAIKDAAKSMSKQDSRDFMKKEEDIPDKVDKEAIAAYKPASWLAFEKYAEELMAGGRKTVDPRTFRLSSPSRPLSPEEKEDIAEESSKWFPDMVDEPGEKITSDMSSPGKGAVLYGAGGALAGGLTGKLVGELVNKLSKGSIDSNAAATAGALTTGSLAAALGFYKRYLLNKTLEDQVSRLPKGATRRDRDTTPAFMLDNPELVDDLAHLNAALVGRAPRGVA